MPNHPTFDRDAYSVLSVDAKFSYCKASLLSMRDTLKPEMPLDDIHLPYLSAITGELQEYLKLFGPIVNEASSQMDAHDIEFLENSCQSIGSVYKALRQATNHLRVAREALTITEAQKRKGVTFDTDLKFKYYDCLQNVHDALTTALQNI